MSDKKAARYKRRVSESLEAALSEAGEPLPFDAASDRLIVFSDQHKGVRDKADDFAKSERAYNAALAYYFQRGHTLVALGDVEELWENTAAPVLRAYERTLGLEAEFHGAGRYRRVWGNHDDLWEFHGPVKRYLQPLFPGIQVPQSILLSIRYGDEELGRLLLLHGHQGEVCSDRYRKIARFGVRYFWRPIQRLTGWRLGTPATDWKLRDGHNRVLHDWAEGKERFVLVAGHTHRPVFESLLHEARLEEELKDARAGGEQDAVAAKRAELEWIMAQDPNQPSGPARALDVRRPAYFNTGCCSYPDGDITGIEIADGEIRLVRWPNEQDEPKPEILAREQVTAVFARCE